MNKSKVLLPAIIALCFACGGNGTWAQSQKEVPGYLVSVYQEAKMERRADGNGGAMTIELRGYTTGSVVLINGQKFILTSSCIAKPSSNPDTKFSSTTVCQFANGSPSTQVTLHGWSEEMGCALFKLDENHPYDGPYVEFGDSDNLKHGARVTAWGTPRPFKLGITFSGVIGGVDHPDFHWQIYEHYKPIRVILHDAIASGGYGGGPLLDGTGRVIGISHGILRERVWLLKSTAVPANDVVRILPKLALGGKVKCGAISPQDRINLQNQLHAAYKYGPEVFISLNGEEIPSLEKLYDEARFIDPGQTAEVTIGDDNARSTVLLVIVEAKDK